MVNIHPQNSDILIENMKSIIADFVFSYFVLIVPMVTKAADEIRMII